jgi:hypothetical protein
MMKFNGLFLTGCIRARIYFAFSYIKLVTLHPWCGKYRVSSIEFNISGQHINPILTFRPGTTAA